MRTALPIPAFARGHARRVAHIQLGTARQSPYHFAIGKAGLEATTEARNDPNAFVDFVMGPRLLPIPKIDWSALPDRILAPVGNAMSGHLYWRET